MKYIQLTWIDPLLPTTKTAFYSSTYDPVMGTIYGQLIHQPTGIQFYKIHIPSEQIISFKLFRRPPMDSIIHIVVHKRWIQNYLKVHDSRFASPVPVITYGDKDYHPLSEDIYESKLKEISAKASNWQNFENWVIPWFVKIENMDMPKHKNEWIEQLNYHDEQLIFGLMGSIALMRASGTELATSRTARS